MPKLTDEEIETGLSAAQEATPGKWWSSTLPHNRFGAVVVPGADDCREDAEHYGGMLIAESIRDRDRRYLVACQPRIVFAALTEIRAARAKAKRAEVRTSLPSTMAPFWYCYIEGERGPKHRHDSREKAENEAERLAREFAGREVLVLMAIQSVRIDVMSKASVPEEDIPF